MLILAVKYRSSSKINVKVNCPNQRQSRRHKVALIWQMVTSMFAPRGTGEFEKVVASNIQTDPVTMLNSSCEF